MPGQRAPVPHVEQAHGISRSGVQARVLEVGDLGGDSVPKWKPGSGAPTVRTLWVSVREESTTNLGCPVLGRCRRLALPWDVRLAGRREEAVAQQQAGAGAGQVSREELGQALPGPTPRRRENLVDVCTQPAPWTAGGGCDTGGRFRGAER